MILLDATALIALLGAEPAATEVRAILADGEAAITTLNLAETADRLERRYGITVDRSRAVLDGLLDGALALVPLGPTEAWRCAQIRASHYHRIRCPISLADAVLIASAAAGDKVASSDRHVLRVAREVGVEALTLPDSQGRIPRV